MLGLEPRTARSSGTRSANHGPITNIIIPRFSCNTWRGLKELKDKQKAKLEESTPYRTVVMCDQRTVGQKHVADISQMFLYNDFSPYFKAAGPNRFYFLCKILLRNASPKAQFQPDQYSGCPVQVYTLTDILTQP